MFEGNSVRATKAENGYDLESGSRKYVFPTFDGLVVALRVALGVNEMSAPLYREKSVFANGHITYIEDFDKFVPPSQDDLRDELGSLRIKLKDAEEANQKLIVTNAQLSKQIDNRDAKLEEAEKTSRQYAVWLRTHGIDTFSGKKIPKRKR